MPRRTPFRVHTWALLVAAFGLAVAGCFNPFSPRVLRGSGVSEPPPAPDSPGNVLRLLEWCYEHRASDEYRELFTADYRFVFSQLDDYGDAYQEQSPWTREDEVVSTTHLFQGGDANQPAASNIQVFLDPNFNNIVNDPRFPGQGRWRKQIRTSVTLVIVDVNQNQTQATGHAVFSLVRGDVALIPEELRERGFGPDSTRWYIERHEDLTLVTEGVTAGVGGGLAATAGAARRPQGARPSRAAALASWGFIKVAYR